MFVSTPDGVLALGGVKSWDPDRDDWLASTEILMPDTGAKAKAGPRFNMDISRRRGCAIIGERSVVVTGGETEGRRKKLTLANVKRFGWIAPFDGAGDLDLPSMLSARQGHACGEVTIGNTKVIAASTQLINNHIIQALVVAGGYDRHVDHGDQYLASTEMLLLNGDSSGDKVGLTGTEWVEMEPLPSPRYVQSDIWIYLDEFVSALAGSMVRNVSNL